MRNEGCTTVSCDRHASRADGLHKIPQKARFTTVSRGRRALRVRVVDLKRAFYYSLSDRGAFRARGLPATVPDSKARVLLELHHPHAFHTYGLRETVASELAQNFLEQEVSVEG